MIYVGDVEMVECPVYILKLPQYAIEVHVELLSWCRGILDRLDKLARDRLLAISNNN